MDPYGPVREQSLAHSFIVEVIKKKKSYKALHNVAERAAQFCRVNVTLVDSAWL